ncbi:hypothetical protein [Leptospira sp. mild_001]|uniref:hypothetical protein n=1 Tax=Leptospira sp. mild_001 TaxID=2838238 RepID=UPI001E2DE98B|nr:hypothetical protein [Leptospira sp. mild_001]
MNLPQANPTACGSRTRIFRSGQQITCSKRYIVFSLIYYRIQFVGHLKREPENSAVNAFFRIGI